MMFDGFNLHAIPHITEAYCTNKECKKRDELTEVSNGFLSRALFCPNCESVYVIKLVKVPSKQITPQYLNNCRKAVEIEKAKHEAAKQVIEKYENKKTKK
jgi:hypothetical protein